MSSAQIPVKIIRSAKRRRTVQARISQGVLQVRIPAWMSQAEEQEAVADMRARMDRKHNSRHASDEELARRAQQLNERYLEGRAAFSTIRWVGNQNFRWGSCTTSTGEIRISDRLRDVPDYVVDAVVIHELTHTFIPGHDAEFWSWANRAPQAERAKGYLEAFQRFCE